MKKMLPFETRRDIYLSFILPHFEYCSESWHFCNKAASEKLEKVNERAVRLVFRDKATAYTELVKKLNLSTLENLRLDKILLSVFKTINNTGAPQSLKELITYRDTKYNLRGNKIISIPKAKTTTYGLKSWRYLAAKLWNSLPDNLRTIKDFRDFKRKLCNIDLTSTQ